MVQQTRAKKRPAGFTPAGHRSRWERWLPAIRIRGALRVDRLFVREGGRLRGREHRHRGARESGGCEAGVDDSLHDVHATSVASAARRICQPRPLVAWGLRSVGVGAPPTRPLIAKHKVGVEPKEKARKFAGFMHSWSSTPRRSTSTVGSHHETLQGEAVIAGSGDVPGKRHGRRGDHRRQEHSSSPHVRLLAENILALKLACCPIAGHQPIP